MLDTIALSISEKDFFIKHPERFSPHASTVFRPVYGYRGFIKATYNPVKAEKATGYKPRLTLLKRPYTELSSAIWLKIEFSAPKLIFGNNFEELRDSDDLEIVLTALHNALVSMGIEIAYDTLLNAKTSMIHYSKNILNKKEKHHQNQSQRELLQKDKTSFIQVKNLRTSGGN